MTFNNLQSENAATFISNDKLERINSSSPYTPTTTIRQPDPSDNNKCNKIVNDCCYSISNLALIIFSILALVFSIKFLHDESLYEYGEHLLSLRFYRQIIFIISILPFILLVPIFNALSSFFINNHRKHEQGNTLSNVKLIYMILMAVLAFVGLVFVAPSIRSSSIAYQLEYEIRGHMKRRYDNDFSYVFLDRIQEEFRCCDELWYRANYFDKLPFSCFINDDPTFSQIYERTCDVAIASLVSTRCTIIAFSLVIILISLASLISIDICEMLTNSHQQYNIEQRESKLMLNSGKVERQGDQEDDDDDDDDDDGCRHEDEEANNPLPPRSSSFRIITNNNSKVKPPIGGLSDNRRQLVNEIENRLRLDERMRETPLLYQQQQEPIRITKAGPASLASLTTPSGGRVDMDNSDENSEDEQEEEEDDGVRLTPILTRANYVPGFRSQSPIFQSSPDRFKQTDSPALRVKPAPSPTKGVLKKTSSFQRIPDDDLDDEYNRQQQNFQDDNNRQQQQQQLHRDIQARRSMLNVRFAE